LLYLSPTDLAANDLPCRGGLTFNLLCTVMDPRDEKISQSDAEPSKAKAEAGHTARRPRRGAAG
jgi:hypothetical protein